MEFFKVDRYKCTRCGSCIAACPINILKIDDERRMPAMVNKGDKIPGIARQTLTFRAGYDITPAWSMGGNLIVSSGQYAHGDENNQDVNGPLGGFAVVNLDSHYNMTPSWQTYAKVTNLFNRNYNTFGILGQNMYTAQSELAVTPSLPRGIWIGFTCQFGGKKNASAELD